MSNGMTHREMHEAVRRAAVATGIHGGLLMRLRTGASVLPVMPDEAVIKRKHFTMGPVTAKSLYHEIRNLKAIGIRQDTFWAMVADIMREYRQLEYAKRDMEQPPELDSKALWEEFIETSESDRYARGKGRCPGRMERIKIDDYGRPLAIKPLPSEAAEQKEEPCKN